MRTGSKKRRALFICAPTPHYLATLAISSAKVVNAFLKDGWEVDIVGLKERQDRMQIDGVLSSLIEGARVFESGSLFEKPSLWVASALKTAIGLIKDNSYEVMISIAPHTWTHVVAFYLKKRYSLPWIAFFADPWGNNPDLMMRPFRRFMEKHSLRLCDAVVYSNAKLRDWALSQFFKDKEEIKNKSFVIPYFYEPSLCRPSNKAALNGRLIIRHMGQVPCGGYIFDLLHALKMLRDNDPSLAKRVLFEFFGRTDKGYKRSVSDLVDELGLRDNAIFYTEDKKIIHVPYMETLRLMGEADGLLLLGIHPSYFHGWGNTVLHVKLVDYLGANKPIFALVGKGSVTHQLLGDYCGVCTDSDPADIKNALTKFISNIQPPPLDVRERFSKERVYPLWQEVIKKVAG